MVDFNISELRETYYSEISSLAEDYQERIEKGEFDDREALQTNIHETLDSHEFVIYTLQAQCVCLASSNDGAIEDLGPGAAFRDGEIQWSAIAFCAMEADLHEALDRLGVDVNDDTTFDREKEAEEDDECEHTRDNDGTCHKCGVSMPS